MASPGGNRNRSRSGSTVVIECAVCGKLFPRGLVDLNRHVNATTLQHLFSEIKSSSFPFGCEKCGLFFTKEEHLTCHNQFSSCGLGGISSGAHEEIYHVDTMDTIDEDHGLRGSIEISPDSADVNRTLECMVCGKLFPRGPVDLQRHATAVTLKHLVSSKRSSAFPFGCNRCGLWLTTAEHLRSHEVNSTCNPNMIWPDNAHSMAGLRAISREEAARQHQLLRSPTLQLPNPNESQDFQESSAQTPLGARKRTIKRRFGDADSPYFTSPPTSSTSHHPNLESPEGKFLVREEPMDPAKRKRLEDVIREDLSQAREKQLKIIIPEDRQAFFAIVSLLIEPKSVPVDKQVTEENFEEFIPEEHRPLVARLKGYVYCTHCPLNVFPTIDVRHVACFIGKRCLNYE